MQTCGKSLSVGCEYARQPLGRSFDDAIEHSRVLLPVGRLVGPKDVYSVEGLG